MKSTRLLLRSLVHYWRINLAIIAGVATAVAVLSGALMVGSSVRSSLSRLLYERIGSAEFVIAADRFFSERRADAFNPAFRSCPIIYLKGVVTDERSRIEAHQVNVYGVDERFWKFQRDTGHFDYDDRAALAGEGLARQLELKPGDELLLRIENQEGIPKEWLYGRRENTVRTVRLTCREILADSKLGAFSLRPNNGTVYSIFVPLRRLQQDLKQRSRANILLLAASRSGRGLEEIRSTLKKAVTPADFGLKLRKLPAADGFALEGSRILLEDAVAHSAIQAASECGLKTSPVFSYLANTIQAGGKSIPYSVITAVDLGRGAMEFVQATQGSLANDSESSIWLTDWAMQDLGAAVGDAVDIDYYVWVEPGSLLTRNTSFRLAGVIPTSGQVNATLAPEIPGITEARSISDWDPPFPVDLSRIRREDEDYWNQYKATPKAFVALARGQQLWHSRFGNLTSVRVIAGDPGSAPSAENRFTEKFLHHLDPERAGFSLTAIKEQGLAAAKGSTDFAEYFVYFSSFLIAAAILLSLLFFKLMIEQRSGEIGILLSLGFPVRRVRLLLLLEGLVLSVAGSCAGLLGAIGYGWLMVLGLRTVWVNAVGTQRLQLHASWSSLAVGVIAGIMISLGTMAWSLHSLRTNSTRALLMGEMESSQTKVHRARLWKIFSISTLVAGLILIAGTMLGKVSKLEGFFGTGFLLLAAVLGASAYFVRRPHGLLIHGHGWMALTRLALRNTMFRPGRSLLCVSLIAAATFIIVSMEAFRQHPGNISLDKNSGTGGYELIAESALPIVHDLTSETGLDSLGLSMDQAATLASAGFVQFRDRPGDDTSCLNLYAPQEPRILGAPRTFLSAGRFAFQNALSHNPEQERNPWLLLESSLPDGSIPAIADANTIEYILHRSLGSEISVRGSKGDPVRLRLVAALKDSIFQGELLISESNFLNSFPDQEGYRFFLLDVPPIKSARISRQLKESLADWGVSVESSVERLSSYHRVENTYLSTFQSLGTLGLLLGTFGLGAVLLRNVIERRREMGLLRAVGFSRRTLSGIVLIENIVLLTWGLGSGTLCALLSIMPALRARSQSFSIETAAAVLLAVLSAGLISSTLAVVAAFRSPLLDSLHSE
jgi:putative ABC transport system permease protein